MKSNTFEANTAGADLLKGWQSLHQQWWQALLAGSKQFDPAPDMAFDNPLKGFSDLFGPKPASPHTAAVERFLTANKQFLAWIQNFSGQVSALGDIPGKVEDWATFFKQSAGSMREGKNPFLHLFEGMAGGGAHSFSSILSGLKNPADMLNNEVKNLLATPAFGYSREQQERAQHLAIAMLEWQEALTAYNDSMLQASKLSFEKMQSKLAEREEPGRQLDSLRAIYDLWIDAAEEAYAEIALSQSFQNVYGNLVNKQMAVQQLLNAEVERSTAQVGMPTRSELNSVHQRLHDMRRRFRELEERLENVNSSVPVSKTTATGSNVTPQPKAQQKSANKKNLSLQPTAPVSTAAESTSTQPAAKKSTAKKSTKAKSIAAKHALARLA